MKVSATAEVLLLDACGPSCSADPLAHAAAALPDPTTSEQLASLFHVLSDPGRMKMIIGLLEAEELCVCDLAELSGLSPTACSHNLRLLRASRIVRNRREGRRIYYALDDAHVRTVVGVARDHVEHATS